MMYKSIMSLSCIENKIRWFRQKLALMTAPLHCFAGNPLCRKMRFWSKRRAICVNALISNPLSRHLPLLRTTPMIMNYQIAFSYKIQNFWNTFIGALFGSNLIYYWRWSFEFPKISVESQLRRDNAPKMYFREDHFRTAKFSPIFQIVLLSVPSKLMKKILYSVSGDRWNFASAICVAVETSMLVSMVTFSRSSPPPEIQIWQLITCSDYKREDSRGRITGSLNWHAYYYLGKNYRRLLQISLFFNQNSADTIYMLKMTLSILFSLP